MAEKKRIIETILLTPLACLYGAVTFIRNKMFDYNILKSEQFDIPVVSIGNVAVGGTGKTPHTEYIISLLKDSHNIAVLSRGYKRKTKGFVLASANSTPHDIGDEAYQIYQKFGNSIRVAVCESRVTGVKKLRAIDPSINLVLLDDAFQHRFIKPSLSIVLTEYGRPLFEDKLLPLGMLRESIQSVRSRADIVIVTKCPDTIKPVDFRLYKKHLDLFPYQKLFFSRFKYDSPIPVFPEESKYIPMLEILSQKDTILAITGIANPKPLVKYLKSFLANVKVMHFPDHHNFSRNDVKDIHNVYKQLKGRYKLIITTEKDAVRVASNPYFPYELKQHVFFQPINVEFLQYEAESFDETLKQKLH